MSDEVRLPLDPSDVLAAAPEEAARKHPTSLDAWARLGDAAYDAHEDVTAYAYYRVGYHRGLDQLRGAGWRPDGHVLWAVESNRGFLRSLFGLMRAAAALGEGVEARRCREFLIQLDPSDPLSVGSLQPKDLGRRLPD